MCSRHAATVSVNTSAVLLHFRCIKGKHWVSPKYWLILTDLHGVVSHKTEIYISVAVITPNLG